MQIELKVKRFHPEFDNRPHFESYPLEVDPNERIMDVLEQVRDRVDGSLAYRRSCGHAVCGSCAMRINGRNRLACKVLVKDVGSSQITLEPLLGLRVIKDLMVDMDPFFEQYRSVLPYLINDQPAPEGRERLQSPEDRQRFDDTTKCILCAACTTSCPSYWSNHRYVGPAALVNAHRFLFDSRDTAAGQRMRILNLPDGVWRCRTVFNCTEACPRDIHITRAIAEIKQTLILSKDTDGSSKRL